MKRNNIKYLFLCLSIFCGVNLFIYSNDVIICIRDAIVIWGQNIIPSLYPFFILSEVIAYFDVITVLNKLTKPLMYHIFHLSPNCAYAFLMSMFSGFPGGAKYTTDLLEQKQINRKEASFLINITHFSNPLFIIGTVGTLLLQNKRASIFILIAHYLSNFILAIITRPKELPSDNKLIIEKTKIPFMTMIANAILKTFQTLIIILGIMMIFLTLTMLLGKWLPLSREVNAIVTGILEMTSGIHKISYLPFSLKEKAVLITAILSFGGFSVHMQVASFLAKHQLSYRPFFISRLKQTLIAMILFWLLYQ